MKAGNVTQAKIKQFIIGSVSNVGTFVLMSFLVLITVVLMYRIPLVEYLGHRFLVDSGFPQASFKISRFDNIFLQISNLSLGPDFKAKRLTVSYQLSDLLKGKLRYVKVEGAKIDISNPEQGIFKFLSTDEKSTSSDMLPFSLPPIQVINAQIMGEYQGVNLKTIFNGSLSPELDISIQAKGDVEKQGQQAAFQGLSIKLNPFQYHILKPSFPVEISIGALALRSDEHKLTFKDVRSGIVVNMETEPSIRTENKIESILYEQRELKAEAHFVKVVTGNVKMSGLGLVNLHLDAESLAVRTADHDLVLKKISSDINVENGSTPTASVSSQIMSATYKQKELIAQADFITLSTKDLTQDMNEAKNVHLTVKHSRVNTGDDNVTVKAIKADMEGTISSQKAHINYTFGQVLDYRLPPLSIQGTANLSAKGAGFDTNIVVNNLKPAISVSGSHVFKTGNGSASVVVGPLTFSDQVQPKDYLKELEIIKDVGGSIGVDAVIKWQKTKPTFQSKGLIKLDKFSLSHDYARVNNLRGSVRIDQMFPLQINDYQTLEADQIVSTIPILNPQIKFRGFQKGNEFILDINHVEVGIVEGVLSIDDTVLNTATPENYVSLKVENLNLAKILKMAAIKGVSAQGKINGTIPFRVGREQLLIDQGLLETDGGGILKIRSEQARQALSGGGEQVGLLLDVLENFHYKDMSLSLEKNEWSDATVRLKTNGHNPAVKNGHPFKLNINVTTNLEKILAMVFQAWHLSENVLKSTFGSRIKNEILKKD